MQSPLPNLLEESQRILRAASNSGVTLRLVGGVAVRLSCPSSAKDPLKRVYRDADLVGRADETRKIKDLFVGLGYTPRETFNAMQGGRRLVFNDLTNKRRVEIFQDFFEMCHKFDLRRRLALRADTLPMADLLETKLQIVQMNDKDYRDMLALLIDHELGNDDRGETLNATHLVGLCADDWGIYKTFTDSLEKVIGNLDVYALNRPDRDVADARRACEGAVDTEGLGETLAGEDRCGVSNPEPEEHRIAHEVSGEPDCRVQDTTHEDVVPARPGHARGEDVVLL